MKFYEKVEEKVIEETKEENQMENNNEKTKSVNKKNKKVIIVLIILMCLLVAAFLLFTGAALLNINNTKIISGVKVNNINLEGLTTEQATKKLQEFAEENIEKDIKLKSEEFEYNVKLNQIELKYKIEEAVNNAYNIGRNENIFLNNFNIIKTKFKGENIELEYEYNEENLDNILEDISKKIPNAVEQASYSIDENILTIVKGKEGNSINKELTKNKILNRVLENNDEEINLDVIKENPEEINIEKIYEEVHKEPKDAYYTQNPFQVFPHENGVDFDVEAAKELLKQEKDKYEIKLTITTPEITTNKIGTEAFPDLLSTFSTRYDTSNIPRTTNLKLAMQKLNGTVVLPGEEFSYNKTLGKRTEAGGYKYAGGYAGGRVVQTLAGGICQISSTLYDAAVYANLEITERHNHMFLAGYVGAGKDATVVYGNLDFKFKNTRKYPIMIKTTIGNGIAKVDIYGVKEEVEYEVEIATTILSNINFKTIYEDDPSMEEGKQKITQGGANGCKSVTYKIVKLNGAEISKIVLSQDEYDPMNKIIARGTKKNETPVVAPVENISVEETSIENTPVEENNKQEEQNQPNEANQQEEIVQEVNN